MMEVAKALESRRAVNFFDAGKDIDESLIKQIYDMAKLAPTSFNLHPWKIVLVHDAEWKSKLRAAAFDQPKVTEAPYVAILLGDKKAYEKMDPVITDMVEKGFAKEENREMLKGMAKGLYGGDNERAFAGRNIGLFAMAFMLAAESLGVSTHPMDGFDAAAVRSNFNIPEDYEIVMLVALGYFDKSKTLLPRASRPDFDEAVVRESF